MPNILGTNMKPLFILSLLVLLTACVSQDLSRVEPSPARIATQPSLPTTQPTSTSSLALTAAPTLWLPSPTPIFDLVIDNIAVGHPGQLYASGFGSVGNDLRQFAQWDGTKWIALGAGFQTAGNVLAVDSAGHLYTEALTNSEQGMATAIMRWDGDKWEDITGNFSIVVDALKAGRISSNIPVVALAIDEEDNLYAAGMFYYPTADYTGELPMGYVAKWNQKNWSVLGQGFDRVNISNLAVSAAAEVYISGDQPLTPEGTSSYFARWDGETWIPLNTSKLNTTQSIALDKSGFLYAYDQSNVIAYWDGTDWTTIADQLGGEAPAVYDMAVDKNGQLCIGGSFESVSGSRRGISLAGMVSRGMPSEKG
jgi:trimeric autotransporter adhesin